MTKEDLEIIGGVIKDTKVNLEKKINNLELKHGNDGLDGENGTDGKNGADGFDGQNGQDGKDGENGQDGFAGQDGTDGLDGENGTDGTDGEKGFDGQDGKDGADGFHGQDGKDGLDGIGIKTKSWVKDEVYLAGAVVTHNIGQYFEAKANTVKTPGESKDWERVGSAGFRHTGGFKKDFDYKSGDFSVKDYGLFLYQDGEHHLLVGRAKATPKYDDTEIKKAMADMKKELEDSKLEMLEIMNAMSEGES